VSSIPPDESPFSQVKLEATFVLPPVYLGKVIFGISELLNDRLLKYERAFQGVLLSYSNISIKNKVGMVFCDVPEIRYRVSFDALLFTTPKGLRIAGTVTKVHAGHLHLKIHGVFPVVIHDSDINDRFKFASQLGQFQDDKGETIAIGTVINFRVKKVHESRTGDIAEWFIEGTMLDSDLGILLANKKPKKRRVS